MSARLDPNELGAAGAILSAAEGVFRAVRGLDARLPDAYQALALSLDRLAMTSHTIPAGKTVPGHDEPPAFNQPRWAGEVSPRYPKLSREAEVHLLAILEQMERFAYFAGRDLLEEGLSDLQTHRAQWMMHVRDLQKILEMLR